MDQLFYFAIVIVVLLVGLDFLARSGGPRVHGTYRRSLGRIGLAIRRQVTRFARWAWRQYHQFILGVVVGIVLALYSLGRLP